MCSGTSRAVVLQPGPDLWRGVVRQVVQHHMGVLACMRLRHLFRNTKKFAPLRACVHSPTTCPAPARGEQVHSAVPHVVMGALLGRVNRDRQQRLDPIHA